MTRNITSIARDFFEACETGKGWEGCKDYCGDNATFTCQADALADVTSIAAYANWVQGLQGPIPDGSYELKAFASDEERNTVVAAAVFHGTQTGEGGPVPPTGKTVATDYVYTMQFDGDKISHMTKVWNDGHCLKQLGWG
jgi:predicted ester cyclase